MKCRMDEFRIWGALLALALLLGSVPATTFADGSYYPKVMESEKGTITIYQPQVESLQADVLDTRAAVAIEQSGQKGLIFGAVWFQARLMTDRDSRTATLAEVKVTAARFSDLEPDLVEKLSRYLEEEVPKWDQVISLDALLADLADEEEQARESRNFNTKPPHIHYRSTPTVLVIIDGDPYFRPLDNTKLEYLANSAFFMVKQQGGRSYYLRGSGFWFTSQDLTGQWTVVERLPDELQAISSQIEADEQKQAEEMAQDAGEMDVARDDQAGPPEIIVSTEPAELVFTNGNPDFATVAGTQLLYLRNSDNDILMDIDSQMYYLLLAGRWYRSSSLEDGPWQFVDPDQLPGDFGNIPPESDMASVLASVAGTQEAREAVLDNQIPQTAEVDRKTATVSVSYDGDPEFESCTDGVAYARNTDKSVLLIDDTYYCCDEAIWFVASGPEGPWQVATELPAKIQDLPPECPVYNVKYVTIYDSTPEVVYVGYTPGYYGSYVHGPCVVYGTGWYYRPWYGYHYYPRPVTYGFGVHYNPYTGWGFSYGISYGWLTVGVGWGRPPYYGMWGAGGYRYGYRHGYWHGYRHGYHRGYRQGIKAGHYPATRKNQGNIYRDRKEGVKRTGGNGRPGNKQPRPSDRKNNIYTDRDGKVYRDRDGKWEERDRGEWKSREERDKSGDRTRDQDRQTRDRERDKPQNMDRDRPSREKDRAQPEPKPKDRSAQPERRDRGQQQLDRDRNSRNRGMERQRQAPQRQTPQKRSPQRQSPQRRR